MNIKFLILALIIVFAAASKQASQFAFLLQVSLEEDLDSKEAEHELELKEVAKQEDGDELIEEEAIIHADIEEAFFLQQHSYYV